MKKGMTKVSVLYPNGANKKFDMDYYCNTHLPLVSRLLGDALKAAGKVKNYAKDQAHHIISMNLIKNNPHIGNLKIEIVPAAICGLPQILRKVAGDVACRVIIGGRIADYVHHVSFESVANVVVIGNNSVNGGGVVGVSQTSAILISFSINRAARAIAIGSNPRTIASPVVIAQSHIPL